jgi:S-formylglutathione hydrolase FrmB
MPFCELRYFSAALRKQTACNVILPSLDVPGPYHVMFLLHGLSDDHTIWARRTSIERYVDGLPLIVVMPDGHRSFYVDAQDGYAYGTALGKELPEMIERYFPTKRPWCISGLSMGGYGAFKLALDRPDLFRSAVSHSGALHFSHHIDARLDDPLFAAEIRRILGSNPVGGPNDLYSQILKCDNLPALRFDCGAEDFLLWANRDIREHLVNNNVPHEYEEFPGEHNWAYWDEHVQEAIAFHRRILGF